MNELTPEIAPRLPGPSGAPQIEVMSRAPGPRSVRTPLAKSTRFKTFVVVFLLVLAAGSLWNFSRPPLYRAVATVLVEVPEGVGFRAGAGGHDVQNVAVQRRILLARELLEDTAGRVPPPATGQPVLDADLLLTMLSVEPTPATNLVELTATGGDPEQLAAIVNAWTDAYMDLRQRQVVVDVDDAEIRAQEEYDRLDTEKRQKTEALEAYRRQHDIDTLEASGNQAMARLNALTADLNLARSEAVKAAAALESFEDAVARGEPVVPQSEQGELNALMREEAQLRKRLEELEKRYTPLYIENAPHLTDLPDDLAELQAQIARIKSEGQAFQRSVLARDLQRANRQVQVQEQQLAAARSEASRFSARFARYERMKQDLAKVDELHQELEAKLVTLRAKAPERYEQAEVVEPAFPPRRPFEPPYWRDLAYTLAAAGVSALLAVLLLEFLGRRERTEDEELPVTGVRVFGPPSAPAAGLGAGPAGPALTAAHLDALPGRATEATEVPSLPAMIQRELLTGEVRALTEIADPASAQLIGLLLAGLTLDDCAALAPEDLDLEAGTLRVPADGRVLALSRPLLERLAAGQPTPLWYGGEGAAGVFDLAARIGLLAHDAGLSHPAEIGIGSLRHTYLCYLTRQGARLTEIERVIGPIPAAELSRYAVFRPSGAAKPLADLDLHYPAFAG